MAAFVASVAFVALHLSNADVPSCKGRELRETNPASRVSTLWVTSFQPLPRSTCYLQPSFISRAESPASQAESPANFISAVHHFLGSLTCCLFISSLSVLSPEMNKRLSAVVLIVFFCSSSLVAKGVCFCLWHTYSPPPL